VSTERVYLSTTIPYVNAPPHLGFALELVQADVLARHYRLAGREVRFQTGTDDNSLKSVLAAAAEGISTGELVDRNAAAFAALRDPLALSFDDFIRTSSDPRHRPGVTALWRACLASGDLYQKDYSGLYCVGCEQFYKPAELPGGLCPEHRTRPQEVTEENWFFRLSRYAGQLHELISSGQLRIEPAAHRNEVLRFIAGGLEDFSVSRSTARARGWGIPVPDDPGQVIYVWWDALGNYVTALGYGTGGELYQRWWGGAGRRIHLAGKGVVRFHAVYWPAILLSARLPLPTDIGVHGYLTIDGRKISKSAAGAGARLAADPAALAAEFGTDAVRWWLLREVPRVGDADFTVARLVARANDDLANGLGNLVSRVTSIAHRYRHGRVPAAPGAGLSNVSVGAGPLPGIGAGPRPDDDAGPLLDACRKVPDLVSAALAGYDFRAATTAVWSVVDQANRYVELAAPWRLAAAERAGDATARWQLDVALGALLAACRTVAAELAPFLPGLAARIAEACDDSAGRLPEPKPLFARLTAGVRDPAGTRGLGG
jgi:methionyl-tRNA synthetase